MTLFFPDLNVWLALSDRAHVHHDDAWAWGNALPGDVGLIFSRYTHIGLLRLLTNEAVMGPATLTLREAWEVYDAWRADARVMFYPEPFALETTFRSATQPLGAKRASKWVGDCYLMAYAKDCGATLVTFDKALMQAARKAGCSTLTPAAPRH